MLGYPDLPEHIAIRFAAKYKDACNEKDPAVGKLIQLADDLVRAGAGAADLRATVFGALLEAYRAGHDTCKLSFKADADARVQGVKDSIRRQVAAVLDKVDLNNQ